MFKTIFIFAVFFAGFATAVYHLGPEGAYAETADFSADSGGWETADEEVEIEQGTRVKASMKVVVSEFFEVCKNGSVWLAETIKEKIAEYRAREGGDTEKEVSEEYWK